MIIDWHFVGWAALAMGAASFVQGFSGFGVGIVAVALLSLFGTVLDATALTNLCAVVLTCWILWHLRGHVHWRMVWPLLLGQAAGLPFGVWFLSSVDDLLARRVMGVLVIAFALWSLLRRKRRLGGRLGPAQAAGVGAASGLMGGAFTMSGPPLIAYIYSRDMDRDALKATIQVCFVFATLLRLVIVASAGHISRSILVTAVLVLPAILLGGLIGMLLARKVGTEPFRRLVWVLFAALGALLCIA